MTPSVATLQRLCEASNEGGDTRKRAIKLRRLLDGRDDPETYDSVRDWKRQCYHWPPKRSEMVMLAANELLATHGVEALECPGHHGNYHFNIHATYCNTGDSYALTLVHDTETGRYFVTSWGDYLEREEAKRSGCWSEVSE